MADASAAQSMMSGLAALRGCHECGLYELEDAITSSFIKGEKTISSALPIDLMHKLATGDKAGHIGDINHVPPLIADFEKQCKRFRLKIKTVTPNKTEVSLFYHCKRHGAKQIFPQNGVSRHKLCPANKRA